MQGIGAAVWIFFLVSGSMGVTLVVGDDAESGGQVMNHRLRDTGVEPSDEGAQGGTLGSAAPEGVGAGQKSGEAPVYGLMKYFTYLTRSSTHNTQILQVLRTIVTEVTDTRIKVDQINDKVDLLMTRVTVVAPQPQQDKRSSFAGFKLFN